MHRTLLSRSLRVAAAAAALCPATAAAQLAAAGPRADTSASPPSVTGAPAAPMAPAAAVEGPPNAPPADARGIDSMPAAGVRPDGRSFAPWAGFGGNAGPRLGATATWTRYGSQGPSFASRDRLRLEWAPRESGFAADYRHQRNAAGGTALTVHARASQIDAVRFHGWGNDTDGSAARDRYLVEQDVVTVEAELSRPVASGMRVGLGPVVRFHDASADAGTPAALAAPLGLDAYGTAGARATLSWDGREAGGVPRRGGWATLAGEAHHGVRGQVDGAFARLRGEGGRYLPLGGTTLALRAGGEHLWGAFPVQQAAFLGGGGSLRGYPRGRFAGDASVWGSAEVRAGLGRAELRGVRGDVGGLLLADAGRVFVDGDSDGGWNTSYGAGLYASAPDRGFTATLLTARGRDGWRTTLGVGLPF